MQETRQRQDCRPEDTAKMCRLLARLQPARQAWMMQAEQVSLIHVCGLTVLASPGLPACLLNLDLDS